jgi:hypothetical protein
MTDIDTSNVTSPAKGEVLPIRPFDETAALTWLRNQPGGRTTLSGAELGRRWGWDRRRVSRRLREWKRAGVVRGRGLSIVVVDNAPPTVPEGATSDATAPAVVAPDVRPVVAPLDIVNRSNINRVSPLVHTIDEQRTTIDLAAYATAIGLATCAACFSVRGMVTLFQGSPVSIVAMASVMEASKLVTAGWLARRWRSTAWIWRLALAGFVLGLAVINAGGTYSQLVAAHVGERGAATASIDTQTANLDARIELAAHAVADLDTRVSQIDSAVAAATQRGRTAGAMSIMDAQRRSRAGLASEREQAAGARSPQGRTRISGRQRAPDRNRGGADPLRRRAGRHGHR